MAMTPTVRPGTPSVSVVIPAFNAERTVGRVIRALLEQGTSLHEVIVVDDGSTDRTAEIAAEFGSLVVSTEVGSAGGARNRGWDAASGDVVLFLDADAVPAAGFGAGLERALAEFPGAVIGCARTFSAQTSWGWVAHLEGETPYLPTGEPRKTAFVSSYCMAVPRTAPLRWDESYGGEDGVFCVDAIDAGSRARVRPTLSRRPRSQPGDVCGPAESTATPGVRPGARWTGSARGGSQAAVLAYPDSLLRARSPGADLPPARPVPRVAITLPAAVASDDRRRVDLGLERSSLRGQATSLSRTGRRRFPTRLNHGAEP